MMKRHLKMLSFMLASLLFVGLFVVPLSGCGDANAEQVTVTFDLNGGEQNFEAKTVMVGETYGKLPEPERASYDFDGWYTSASGGRHITAESEVVNISDHTLYAHWLGAAIEVTFDPNGGMFTSFGNLKQNADGTATKETRIGDKYGTIPVPDRAAYFFDGWYLDKDCTGKRLLANTVISEGVSHKVYAKWAMANTSWTFENGENSFKDIDDSLGVGLIFDVVERGEGGNHMLKVDPKDVWQRSNADNPDGWFCSVRFNRIQATKGDTLTFKVQFDAGSTMIPLLVLPLYTTAGDRLGDQNGYPTGTELNCVSITLEHDIDNLRIELISPSKPDWVMYIDDVIITYAES